MPKLLVKERLPKLIHVGKQGLIGAPGLGWFISSGVPSVDLGRNGENCLDADTGDVYLKVDNAWGVVSNIKGGDGLDGEDGLDGLDGEPGAGLPAGGAQLAIVRKASAADHDYELVTLLEQIDLKACPEVGPAVIDATAGGIINIDFLAGPVQLIEVGTVDVTFTFSNFPAVGKSGSVTIDIKFTGASLPGFTWPQLVAGLLDPDLSKATPVIGRGLVEVFLSLDGSYWVLRSGVV